MKYNINKLQELDILRTKAFKIIYIQGVNNALLTD